MNTIADYRTSDTKLLPYLPYPRFLLGADLTQTAKVLYAVLLDRSNLSRANGWTDEDGNIFVVFPLNKLADMVDKGRIVSRIWAWGLPVPLSWTAKSAHIPASTKLSFTKERTRSSCSAVQDEGWYQARERYQDFLRRHDGLQVVFLELGVGGNTPVIIKYPFWKMTVQNPQAVYACVNMGQAYAPKEISEQAVVIGNDIGSVLKEIRLAML